MLLSPLQSKNLLSHALQNQYAILAVNADSHAAISDCMEAAFQADAPLIIETSLWQLKGHSFGVGDPILGLARYLADLSAIANSTRYANIPVIYHTDHIKGPETISILEKAIKGVSVGKQVLTASTISLDASDFSEKDNIEQISLLCKIALENSVELCLEMESAVDDRITPPDETERLLGAIEASYPDTVYLWAPGVGTQHGFSSDDGYKAFDPKTIEQNVRLIKKITGREFGIALHGSTGLDSQKLQDAAKAGVTKVNWSSESLYIRSMASQKYYFENKEKFERSHKDWKNAVMDNGLNAEVSKVYVRKVVEKMHLLHGAGMARKWVNSEISL